MKLGQLDLLAVFVGAVDLDRPAQDDVERVARVAFTKQNLVGYGGLFLAELGQFANGLLGQVPEEGHPF